MPSNIRDEVTLLVWAEADALDWLRLPAASKSRYYDNWTADSRIGGRLSRFLDAGQVRLYIKDAVMKRYSRTRRAQPARIMKLLQLPADTAPSKAFIKPHGFRLADGRVASWGHANGWKMILLAVHERAFEEGGRAFGAVLTQAAPRFAEERSRAVVEDAARKLGIEKLIWVPD